jgi:hypothetical protein
MRPERWASPRIGNHGRLLSSPQQSRLCTRPGPGRYEINCHPPHKWESYCLAIISGTPTCALMTASSIELWPKIASGSEFAFAS